MVPVTRCVQLEEIGVSDPDNFDPRSLTFSQAYGYEPLPAPLALEEISDDARLQIYNLLYTESTRRATFVEVNDPWRAIFRTLHQDFLKEPLDSFSYRTKQILRTYRRLILLDLPFNRLFDLLLMILQHQNCPPIFAVQVVMIFERCQLAYRIDLSNPPIIFPAATPQEGEAISDALTTLREAGLIGTEAHLRRSIERLNNGDWPGSIGESVHAVESVARYLDPNSSNSLSAALNSLERHRPLHSALKQGFKNIYGYTSDEEGIRHALINSSESPAGQDEAIFMLGACASFASYLWRVGQAANKQIS